MSKHLKHVANHIICTFYIYVPKAGDQNKPKWCTKHQGWSMKFQNGNGFNILKIVQGNQYLRSVV